MSDSNTLGMTDTSSAKNQRKGDVGQKKKKRNMLRQKLGLGVEDSTGGLNDGGKLSGGAIAYNIANP